MLEQTEIFTCAHCGFELDNDNKKKIVAIEAEAPPPVGLSDDPLGVEAPEPEPDTPPKYNIMDCPNCGNNTWLSKEA